MILSLTDISPLPSLRSAPSQKAEQRRCWCCAFCRALSVSAARRSSLSLRSPVPLCLKTRYTITAPHARTARLFVAIMSLAIQFTAEACEVRPWKRVLNLSVVFGGIRYDCHSRRFEARYRMAERDKQTERKLFSGRPSSWRVAVYRAPPMGKAALSFSSGFPCHKMRYMGKDHTDTWIRNPLRNSNRVLMPRAVWLHYRKDENVSPHSLDELHTIYG